MTSDELNIDEITVVAEIFKELEMILDWLRKQSKKLDPKEVSDFAQEIINFSKEKIIFLGGMGRSGYAAKAFAMRLEHLGRNVRYLDETTLPRVKKGDLVILYSGSGDNLDDTAEIAKGEGAKIIAITSIRDSKLARQADLILIIPGREQEDAEISYLERRIKGKPAMPLGSSFEVLAWLLTAEAFIGYLAAKEGKKESDLKEKHAKPQI